MPQMIFVNLPVRDLPVSRKFYAALGFTFNEQLCDDSAACLVISEHIFCMLLTHERFTSFCDLPIADPKIWASHLLALSRDDRDAVDTITRTALLAGGSEPRPAQDMGFLYSRSFTDPDGHIWEPFWMDMSAMPPDQPT